MSRASKIGAVVVSLFAAWVVLGVAHFCWHFVSGKWVTKPIVSAMRDRFPDAQIKGQPSAERPMIYLQVDGMQDCERRIEMKDWLVNYAAEKRIGWDLRLLFYSEDVDERSEFIIPRR